MIHRTSLLRQHIQQALAPSRRPWLMALALCSGQPITPLYAADNHYLWDCRPSADGNNWQCDERASQEPAYQRPAHAKAARSSASQAASRALSAAARDWVPEEQLTPAQREAMNPGCCGLYQEPTREDADADADPELTPVRATASRSELLQETTTVMTGDVRMTKGFRQLSADKATINQKSGGALMEGNVQLREPGLLLTGDKFDLNLESGAARIDNASYLIHASNLRGAASSISRGSDESLVLKDGSLTRCEPGNNTWLLRGSEIRIDPAKNEGVGKHLRMNVKGVPIVYVPYLRFSTSEERLSGFLFPSISSTDDGGIDVTIPYYLNLAPNYDMTLSPRFISDRGAMLETELRHLSPQFATAVSGAYLADDDGGSDSDLQKLVDNGRITADQANPYQGSDRWLFNIDQQGGLDARWYSEIDFTAVSDDDYFRDMDTASLQVNSSTHIKKSGLVGYQAEHWNYRFKAEQYESISSQANTPYKQLPRINADGRYVLGSNWIVELNNEFASFDHRDADDDMLLTGDRLRLDYGLTWNKQWMWGFFKPGIGAKSLAYQFDDEHLKAGANDSPSFAAGQASLDTGLIFERDGSLFNHQYLQTFEPRLFYFYSQHENQDELIRITDRDQSVDFDSSDLTFSYSQLFRDSRFSGGDRIDDDNRLSVGLTSRILDPSDGREIFSASLGQIFYFDDRTVELDQTEAEALNNPESLRTRSEYAAQVTAQVGNSWRLQGNIEWDAKLYHRINGGSASLRYKDESARVFNLSYRYLRKPSLIDTNDADNDGFTTDLLLQSIEQVDFSFALPIYGNWNAVARYNYDFTHERELESLFGVEYNNCCYLTRLVARRWLDNELIDVVDTLELEEDTGIFFEFHFKTLGGIGSKVSNILKDSIYGYTDRD